MNKDSICQVAVVGVGRMGRHHARIYSQLPQARLVAVVDHDEERRETMAEDYGCRAYASIDALLEKVPSLDGVTIATPTRFHHEAARPFLERSIPCLIEKPLAGTVDDARAIAQLAIDHDTWIQVGHTERFNPVVRSVAGMQMLPRFIEIDRVSPMTFRSLDVGVVMDMMIHDLDLVLMFAGSSIRKVDAAGVAVLGEHEDIASARIVFANGCVANLTASRLALKTERKMRMFSEHGYVSLDFQKRAGTVVRRNADNMDILAQVREQLANGRDLSDLDYSSLIHVDELAMDDSAQAGDPLTCQLNSFLTAIREGTPPVVTAADGLAAISAAEAVVNSLREHKWEGLQDARLRI